MPSGVRILHLPPLRARAFHDFFLALRRGLTLGRCRACETFYLMAKLCLEEDDDEPGLLRREERAEVASWVEAGSMADAGFGCEGACALIPLYSRLAG